MTHSCARMIICKPLASQNSLTRSGPNVTSPGPRALGRSPKMLSFSVGSLMARSGAKNQRGSDVPSYQLALAPPQQVHEHDPARLHRQRTLQLLKLLHALNGFADAAWKARVSRRMHAQHGADAAHHACR